MRNPVATLALVLALRITGDTLRFTVPALDERGRDGEQGRCTDATTAVLFGWRYCFTAANWPASWPGCRALGWERLDSLDVRRHEGQRMAWRPRWPAGWYGSAKIEVFDDSGNPRMVRIADRIGTHPDSQATLIWVGRP